MTLSDLIPKRYAIRLMLMMLFFGLVPFAIFEFLMGTFEEQFQEKMEQAIQQGQEEEDRRGMAILTQWAEDAIRQKALDEALQVELYMRTRPGITTGQLQNDPIFGEIAVQPVLKEGYNRRKAPV